MGIKKLISICLLATLFCGSQVLYAKDKVEQLWKAYDKAQKADLPQDQMRLLESIRNEADEQHLAWDFYLACSKYAELQSSTNWKFQEKSEQQKAEFFAKFDEPILTLRDMQDRYCSISDRLSLILRERERLQRSHNPNFYKSQLYLPFADALISFIDNDLDYAIWSLISANPELLSQTNDSPASSSSVKTHKLAVSKPNTSTNQISNTIRELADSNFKARYPHDALIEFLPLKDSAALLAYELKYQDKAVSLYAGEKLLQLRKAQLDKLQEIKQNAVNEAVTKRELSSEYANLEADAKALLHKTKSFCGSERKLAQACEYPKQLIKTLRERSIEANVKDGILILQTRNIAKVRVRIKSQLDSRLKNTDQSFYCTDTISLKLPDLPDGDYQILCSHGSREYIVNYTRNSISIVSRSCNITANSNAAISDANFNSILDAPHSRDIYIAHYQSGEAIPNCTLSLYDADDKVLASVEDFHLDGFTPLPDEINNLIQDKLGQYIRASYLQDGKLRLSDKLHLYRSYYPKNTYNENKVKAILLSDRSAYKPGESVQFKAIIYSGSTVFRLAEKATKLQAILLDPDRKEIAAQELTTNEFGSVAGQFLIPADIKGGSCYIHIKKGNEIVSTKSIIIDEFVLPSFELIWDEQNRRYLPEDIISFAATIKSYSGHTLSSAKISYIIRDGITVISKGSITPDKEGRFNINAKASAEDYSHYSITVKAVDATGESLEWSNYAYASSNISFYPIISNVLKSKAEIDAQECALVYDKIELDNLIDYPRTVQSFSIYKADDCVLETKTQGIGKTIIDLSALPSGLYSLVCTASLSSDQSKIYTSTHKRLIYIIKPGDKQLYASFDCFFKEPESDELSVQIGLDKEPLWLILELYAAGDNLLESKLIRLDPEGGSLQSIGFTPKSEYKGNLSLKVFYFKSGQYYLYSRYIELKEQDDALPLQFTRFLDTTAPSKSYTFQIKTNPNVECAASISDVSSETISSNAWYSIHPIRPYEREPIYNVELGTNSGYGHKPIIGLKRSGMMKLATADYVVEEASYDAAAPLSSKALSRANGSDESIAFSSSQEQQEPVTRSNFVSTIAWEPFLRSDDKGEISLSFANSDQLSRYKVQLFAHDKSMRNQVLNRTMTVTLPVKVAIVQPQFLYSNDEYIARVLVNNAFDIDVEGDIFIQGANRVSKRVKIAALKSEEFSSPVKIVGDTLSLTIGFTPLDSSLAGDAVLVEIPIQQPSQSIRESHSAILRQGQNKKELIDQLKSEFVNFPSSKAEIREISIRDMLEEALPEEIEPRGEDILSLIDALYSRTMLGLEQTEQLIEKIMACQGSKGGYSWFAGMASSPAITASVLRRLIAMGEACPERLRPSIESSARYLDEFMLARKDQPSWCGGISLEQYLSLRTACPQIDVITEDRKSVAELSKQIRDYLVPSGERGLNAQIYAKAVRAESLANLLSLEGGKDWAAFWSVTLHGVEKSLAKDLASLAQYAQLHSSGGVYFPNAEMSYRDLLDSELRAHTLLCKLMQKGGYNDIAEGMRLWIMLQKETQNWSSDPAYIEALSCVKSASVATLDTKVLELSANGKLAFEDIKSSSNGFTLRTEYYKDGKLIQEGDTLRIGDKIKANYIIWSAENRSFVRLIATRNAALRPIQQLSGIYAWAIAPLRIYGIRPQAYRWVKTTQSEYYFDTFPEENFTIEEEFFVTQQGRFSAAAATIESFYSPHYRANGTVNRIKVDN